MFGNISSHIFVFFSAKKGLKFYNKGKLIFGYNMILLTKHMEDWELIHQNQLKIDKDNISKNSKIIY